MSLADRNPDGSWEKSQALFHQALELPEHDRKAFVESASQGDPACLSEVLEMLRGDCTTSPLLDDISQDQRQMLARHALGNSFQLREIGPYKLLSLLGEGGMGVVWLAEREDTGRKDAIKLLPHASLTPARSERFAQEIRTLAKLNHPSIARLYDAGTLSDDTPWFVMEYVEGLWLTDYCAAVAPSLEQRLALFHRICEAVQYAQGEGVIHRDLKPSNILIEKNGTPRLLDFGIARELQGVDASSEQTRPGLRFFSPDYAAPEWIEDGTVGLYTDVYSLGVLLYQLLTGKLPSASATDPHPPPPGTPDLSSLPGPDSVEGPASLASARSKNAPRPSTAARALYPLGKRASSELDLLCAKAMHRDWHERYKSAEALLRDLDHYRRNEPLEARPDSTRYRVTKFVERNRRPVFATAITLALIVALVVFFTVRLTRARNAALAETARTQRIQHFMLNLFGESEKSAAPSSDLRAITLLDRGVIDADALQSDPETQAELFQTLGRMYDMLGDFPKSTQLLNRALQKAKTVPQGKGDSNDGSNELQIANLLVLRGIVLADRSQFPQAEQSVRDGLAIFTRRLPAHDPALIYAESSLGRVIGTSGRYRQAIAILQPLVDQTPPGLLPTQEENETFSQTLTALANAQSFLGLSEASEAINRRSLVLDRSIFGDTHPRVAGDLLNMALNENAQSHYAQAEQFERQSIAILNAWYGPDHPDTAEALNAYARTLMFQGKENEAYPISQRSLTIEDKAYGRRDIMIAITLDTLGRIETHRGDLTQAAAHFARALEMVRSLYGDQDYQFAVVAADLGEVRTRQHRPAEGESLLHDAVIVLQQDLPAGDQHIARAQAMYGHCLLTLHRFPQAGVQLNASLAVLEKHTEAQALIMQTIHQDLVTLHQQLPTPPSAQ